MAEVDVNEEYGSSANAVWALIADFGGLADWAPGLEGCELEGEGVGSVRTLQMPGGVVMKERLESLDDAGRSLSYSLIDGPSPAENYLATMTVTPRGDGCRVDWKASFDVAEAIQEPMEKGVAGAYSAMLQAMKAKLGET